MESANCLFKEEIASGLGVFELRMNTTGECIQEAKAGSVVTIQSTEHTITIKKVTAPTAWLPLGMRVDAAMAWLIYITKHEEGVEQIRIEFTLPIMPSIIQSGANTGEHLTAIEFENGIRQVHIGTQDEDWFAQSSNGAWMPQRLVPMLVNDLLVSDIRDNGLVTIGRICLCMSSSICITF
jgi:hypothetical protein